MHETWDVPLESEGKVQRRTIGGHNYGRLLILRPGVFNPVGRRAGGLGEAEGIGEDSCFPGEDQ